MKSRLLSALILATGFSLVACGSNPNPTPMPKPSASASPIPEGAPLSGLLNQSLDSSEQAARINLLRKVKLEYPIRVALAFSHRSSQLNSVDQQAIFDETQKIFKGSGLVADTILLPPTMIGYNPSLDSLRQVAARFKAHVVVLITVNHSFQRAESQPLNFFDSFTDKAYYESDVQLDAVTLDIFSGSYLNPISSASRSEPLLLSLSDNSFNRQAYPVKKETEIKAWERLRQAFIDSIVAVKEESDKLPSLEVLILPSPTPTPGPTPSPTVSPTTGG